MTVVGAYHQCPVEVRMHEMIEYALTLNQKNKIVAFLWHQGEHDIFEGTKPEYYEKQLTELVNSIRRTYGCEQVQFIAGDLCNEWKSKNLEKAFPIVERIKTVFSQKKCGFVETSDLLSNNQLFGDGDDIHFCREALRILGGRYFEEYYKIIRQTN